MVEHYPPACGTEHYLETSSVTKNDWLEIGSLISLVNDSLFCAHVRFLGGPVFVSDYPTRMLKVESIHGNQERDGRWRYCIRLVSRGWYGHQGFWSGGKWTEFKLYHEANFQHIFRSSLVWTVGYFRIAERDAEMRTVPQTTER